MISLNAADLAAILQCPLPRAALWAPHINNTLPRYDIVTAPRLAAYLAQVGHESARLRYVRELWDPAKCPWQGKYEGRADLGNTQPGDGHRFLGRGLIQITGRDNYRRCAEALGLPLLTDPALLEQPAHAAESAAWFWQSHGLNELADAGNFRRITLRINGGLNGYADRMALFSAARDALA